MNTMMVCTLFFIQLFEGKRNSPFTYHSQTLGKLGNHYCMFTLFFFLLQRMQSWSSGSWQRASHWSSPVPLRRSTAAWRASTFTAADPRARPPCCQWLRAASSGSTRSTGGVCSSVEACSPCRSMWPYQIYSPATRDSTCGSWATERRTAPTRSSSVLKRCSCWLKGQVCSHVSQNCMYCIHTVKPK